MPGSEPDNASRCYVIPRTYPAPPRHFALHYSSWDGTEHTEKKGCRQILKTSLKTAREKQSVSVGAGYLFSAAWDRVSPIASSRLCDAVRDAV